MSPAAIVWMIRAGVVLAAAGLVYAFLSGAVNLVRAPVQAELDASRGNQAAAKAGIEAQNKGIDGLQAAARRRKADSEAAVKNAGKADFERAEAIAAKPAPGDTPLARAANRINAEFGK